MFDFDILIRGGMVFDGTGETARRADVGIRDGLIANVGLNLSGSAKETIDATDRMVTPGFVGVHTHYRIASRNFVTGCLITDVTGRVRAFGF